MQISRRQFVAAVGAACACACAGTGAAHAARQLAEADNKGQLVDAGPVSAYAADGVTSTWASSHRFYLVRRENRLYAVAAGCTHQTAALVQPAGGRLACPRHGSMFGLDGKVLRGPARRPLPRHGITLNEQGRVIVDTGRWFNQDQWDQPGSFIALPPA